MPDADSDADTYSNPDTDGDCHPDGHTHTGPHSDTVEDRDPHRHCDGDPHHRSRRLRRLERVHEHQHSKDLRLRIGVAKQDAVARGVLGS